jgi:hypothetical protein
MLGVVIRHVDVTPPASPPVGVTQPAFPPVGVTPPVVQAEGHLVVVPPGGGRQAEPDGEPGYALPTPCTSAVVPGPATSTLAPDPSVVAGDSSRDSPALDGAAGASAGDPPGRWRGGNRVENRGPRERSLPRSLLMNTLLTVFNETDDYRRQKERREAPGIFPPAVTDARERPGPDSAPAASSDDRLAGGPPLVTPEQLQAIAQQQEIRSQIADRSPADGPPPATPEMKSQIEQELQASLESSRVYVDTHQQAQPVFSPLMVIPGAAN